MLKEEVLFQIREYLVSKGGDNVPQVNTRDLERGELISSKLNPGESLEYIDQIEREGRISIVSTIDAISIGNDPYDNNNKLITYRVNR